MDPKAQLRDSDLCVKCGLCAPHCPTYRLSLNESESPRGRISIIQGLMQGALSDDPAARGHLENCLLCRACEAVCPARVPFGRIMDAARTELIPPRERDSVPERLLQPSLGRLPARMARLGRGLGFRALAKLPDGGRLGSLRQAGSMLHALGDPPPGPRTPAQADVALFPGCTSELFDGAALNAALAVLEALGQRVFIPGRRICCGALARHAGRSSEAARQALETGEVFAGFSGPIISLNSGCRAHLREDQDQTSLVRAGVTDLCVWLQQQDLSGVRWREDALRVALHTPCSLRHVLGEHRALESLLRHLPGIELLSLPENEICCGAAGSHLLSHADMADRLLEPKLGALRELAPAVLVSANVGCRIHFVSGMARTGMSLPVLHPAELIALRMGLS